ncbi:hypothetical protein Egran_03341 [Elaphomyces granulatus]|uniref:ABC transmembrane type-1 domain-containing protein n=1 Tax=Elaphomyces granulatus TaxID=519963 RepID=A0A232LXK6_9EURO|nr:hypothetical protein Egran_03341 [Elaphomyces granulatus]
MGKTPLSSKKGQSPDAGAVDGGKQGESVPMSNYWRIFSYRTRQDSIILFAGIICAVGAGIALPLMNVVFGNLVGDFNSYFIPSSGPTEEQFKNSVNTNAWVPA